MESTILNPVRLLLLGLMVFCLAGQAVAQNEEMVVSITRLDDRAYPRLVTQLVVVDKHGLPVTGLTEANFALQTDDQAVTDQHIIVESDVIKGLRLVLAIDLSTSPQVLTQVKSAAKQFVRNLEPEDKLALVAFYEDIELVYDFTNNVEALETAIDSLSPTGSYTALNKVILESGLMVEQFETGRRALIILTDSKNNIGASLLEAAVEKTQETELTLYAIGLETEKVRPRNLEELARQTKGLAAVVNPNEAEVILQQIAGQLRQGYRVIVQSQLPADNAGHTLSLAVSSAEGSGQTTGQFVARPGEVTVTLLDVEDGQPVAGIVSLIAGVSAPAPVVAVEYLVDGQTGRTVHTPPYRFDWDSSGAALGSHSLTARAVDAVGNEGQSQVQLNVVSPLVVEAITDQASIEMGDQVTVQARIEALAPVAEVVLLLDGQLLKQDDSPPYEFSFNSDVYSPGDHILTIQVRDRLGRVADDSVPIEFQAPRQISWLRLAAAILTLLIALLLLLLLVWWLLQQRLKPHRQAITITNKGNAISRYKLRAEDPANILRFEFELHDKPLDPLEIPVEGEPSYR